jgi:glycerol uptake facilitator-like aquaporin
LRAYAAEFLGTFALVFGCGAIANGLPPTSVALAFGLVIAVMIYALVTSPARTSTRLFRSASPWGDTCSGQRWPRMRRPRSLAPLVALWRWEPLSVVPISGASMNPARSIGPAIMSGGLANL